MKYEHSSEIRMMQLKKRVKRCVCKYCGSPLKLRKIVFSDLDEARVEIFCKSCNRIEYGVEPEVYACAAYFVDELGFNYYPDLEESVETRRLNIAKVCEVSSWTLKNLGLLTEEGFVAPLKMQDKLVAECLILTNEDLDEIEPEIEE